MRNLFLVLGLVSWWLPGPLWGGSRGPKEVMETKAWLGRSPGANNRPNRSKTLSIGHLRVDEGGKGRRPNAQHYPSRSTCLLRIGDSSVAGALTRREQPPEPEQSTS